MGNQYFSQVKGVPQGSVLSTVLCNLYYGMIEKKFLGFPDHTDENSTYLLMRLTDDFLFISTSRARAEFFANKVHQGLPEYGFRTNTSKTKLNFELSYNSNQDLFWWRKDGSNGVVFVSIRQHLKFLSITLDFWENMFATRLRFSESSLERHSALQLYGA